MLFFILFLYPYLLASSTHAGLLVIPLILFLMLSGRTSCVHALKNLDWRLWGISGIALLSFCFWDREATRYEIFRDIYYFIKPVLFVYAGMLIFEFLKRDYRRLLQYVVIVIAIQTTVFLCLKISQAPFSFSIENRGEFGVAALESYLLFIITSLALKKNWLLFSRKLLFLFLMLGVIGTLLSLGRTYYAILAISIVLILVNRRKFYIGCAILMLSCSMVIILFGEQLGEWFYSEAADYTRLTEKIQNSFCEILPYERTGTKINTDWRGFEAYLGLQMFHKGFAIQQIFGRGFGAICYNDVFKSGQLASLPIFHNGYITILLKAGWSGILLFFLFLLHLLKFRRNNNSAESDFAATLTALLVCNILIMTQVTHGIFTSSTQFFLMILIGSHIAYFKRAEEDTVPAFPQEATLYRET